MDLMMLSSAAPLGDGSTLWTFFGRFHPATVHFPVALLIAAAMVEGWQLLRKKPGLSPATLPLIVLGVATAVVSTLMGWANASGRKHDDLLETHRWAGVATTVVALIAMGLVLKARNAPKGALLQGARAALLAGTVLVGLTGHWGGKLVFGAEYYSSGAPDWLRNIFWPEEAKAENGGKLPLPMVTDKINFETQIAPIIKESCIKCHNPGKKKGKLLLDTKANAMKGGENGPIFVPGKPLESSFYKLLIDPDEDVRMPEKAKPLPKDQIETIKKWIEQGAEWPDNVTIK